MGFNRVIFLLIFLPVFTGIYFLTPGKFKNFILVMFSLLFYFSFDQKLPIVLLMSAVVNYAAGILSVGRYRKAVLIVSLAFNILILFFFKYLSSMTDMVWRHLGIHIPGATPDLLYFANFVPLGISFFTFRAISYAVDVYRGKTSASRNFIDFFCYFSLFPLIVAGPIVRYADVSHQLKQKNLSYNRVAEGIERFIIGLGKKVIIAGTFTTITTYIFSVPLSDLSTGWAWIGILAYTMEIYYDFSGYTDMAIGIGKIIGFDFAENFNFPYAASDIRDFWRRWHMSLSQWLRDYIFLPLAYLISRKLPADRYLNIKTDHLIYAAATAVTFFICGYWHGANGNFIVWGLYFAFFLIMEQLFLGKMIRKTWFPLRHIYTMAVVTFGWVIFRSFSISEAMCYFGKLFVCSPGSPTEVSYLKFYVFSGESFAIALLAVVFATPLVSVIKQVALKFCTARTVFLYGYYLAGIAIFGIILVTSISYMTLGTYSPFLYLKF